MYYEINVAKKRPTIHGVDGGYSHFFATDKRSCQTYDQVKEVVKTLLEKFSEPEYKISVTRWDEIGHGVDMNSFSPKGPEHRLLEMLDIEKCKKMIQACPENEVVILLSNWSIICPKYSPEEYAEGIDDLDWEEVEKALDCVLQVSQFDDLIVDPKGIPA